MEKKNIEMGKSRGGKTIINQSTSNTYLCVLIAMKRLRACFWNDDDDGHMFQGEHFFSARSF